MSHASKNRLSQYSTTGSLHSRSRPPSHVFAIYPSSLPYALVRDFAYSVGHPLHYGPPPEPSRPPSGSWTSDGFGKAGDLAPIHFGDGPPWSEDEDLHSPVVSSRHRKHKSGSASAYGRGRASRDGHAGGPSIMNADNFDQERGCYVGTGGDGSERYYVNQGGEANGPGGEYVTYPAGQARQSHGHYSPGERQHQGRPYIDDAEYPDSDVSSGASSPGFQEVDESRYSRDYQFTITSPDEEMHGKAVALFDFERENENELPLVEGQIVWVSYRHSLGWLVAEDPKTQESGLVPEEYVRLLRDIEGGMTSLINNLADGPDNEIGTPTQAEHSMSHAPANSAVSNAGTASNHTPTASTSSAANGYTQPKTSTFSTSSKDLNPYPQHLLGTQAGQTPPQVVHYHGQRGGSQANTPTLLFHQDIGMMRRGSQNDTASGLETLPDARLVEKKPGEDKPDTSR
ncbi:HOG (high osmolarity glycerol) pathway protein [Coniochaeta pulveracea]|uniref:HOG (High osmolarity glycerol) pathway protein n=1 Tax=Coniochaeta pulveracea TaxID=177199 RepID=A0A420Y9M1_9PEZI|nr:HOG (high osmolarity glycerol) pathway protein [Coniochaeta pulveracea]